MRNITHTLLLFTLSLSYFFLISCQASNVTPLTSNPPPDNPNPQTAPLVRISFNGFDPETTNLRFTEGQIITFELDTLDSTITSASLSQISGPIVNFGELTVGGFSSNDGDVLRGDGVDDIEFTFQDVEGPRRAVLDRNLRARVEFVAPSVSAQSTITFRFQSSSSTQSRTRRVPIIIEDDAGAITLTGQVSKGLVSNTRVRLFSVDGFIEDILGTNRQIVEPVQIDNTGTYRFTLPPAIDFEELLLYEIEADGADMICDAPQGCNSFAFGETFEVEDDLDLRAFIPVPQLGTTQIVNINILTTLTARSAQNLAEGFERVDAEDVSRGQQETARIFGLPNQDFTRIPFVDVTRPITSTNETAIRAAMIGGGVLGATFAHSDPDDDEDYLEELDDFIDDYGDGLIACQNSPEQTTLSFEDIMVYALQIAEMNGSAVTQNFFRSRLNGIRNGTISCDFLSRVQ